MIDPFEITDQWLRAETNPGSCSHGQLAVFIVIEVLALETSTQLLAQ